MSNRLNFTEDDAWAVLFLATFPAAFPTRAMDICAAACSAAGDRQLSAAVALREIGVIELSDAGYIVLGSHPFAQGLKVIGELVAAQFAVETTIAAHDAFELLALTADMTSAITAETSTTYCP